MADTLSKDTKKSILWNGLDKAGFQVIALIVGLITTRMLTPDDFGLIGALAIFTALSNILVESGFTSAMVRRKNNTDAEYMGVLIFNILISIVAYLLLYICAPFIAHYYNEPPLTDLSRLLFTSIILNAFSIIQTIVLTQKMEFKTLSQANIYSALLAGIITIVMIFLDFGFWALAWQIVLQNGFKSLFLWLMSPWKITKNINTKIIRELFSFSTSLIGANVMITTIRHIYSLVIGRSFSIIHLGYYTQAFKYHQIPANVVSSTINGVAYPVLSRLNEDEKRQLVYFRKLVRVSAFCIFPVMLGLMAAFDNLVYVALTAKWLPIVPYFRILCVAAIFLPLHNLNTSLITLKGYPRKNFQVEVFRNAIIILSLILFRKNIELMLISFSASYVASFLLGSYFTSKFLPYSITKQIRDLCPYAIISIAMATIVYFIPQFINFNIYIITFIQVFSGILFYVITLKLLGSTIFNEITNMLNKKGAD